MPPGYNTLSRKERDELKEELAKVEMELQIAYAKERNSPGFKGGFGGGHFGGGGAFGNWNYQL